MNTTPVNNLRGIAFLVAAGLFLTTNDGISKWLVPHYPVGQLLFVQAALITLITAIVMRLRGEAPLAARRWRPHFYRGGLYVIGSFAFVFALRYLPFAEVVAIAFAGPMFMTLFGRFFPRRVGRLAPAGCRTGRFRRGPVRDSTGHRGHALGRCSAIDRCPGRCRTRPGHAQNGGWRIQPADCFYHRQYAGNRGPAYRRLGVAGPAFAGSASGSPSARVLLSSRTF